MYMLVCYVCVYIYIYIYIHTYTIQYIILQHTLIILYYIISYCCGPARGLPAVRHPRPFPFSLLADGRRINNVITITIIIIIINQ